VKSIDDLDVRGRRVLVRVDFNVPLRKDEHGEPAVADDTRIVQALPTIEALRARGARLILVSHLGRPEGRPEADLSLAPVVHRLRELTDAKVTLSPEVVGVRSRALADGLSDGEILVLENVRFDPGETAGDPDFARALAGLADAYVNDAFGAAHRAHASTTGVAALLPSAAGLLLEREVRTLTGILENPERPLLAVIGGAKVADKIAMIDRFLALADVVIIGGAMCFPFLRAQGHTVGSSLCEAEEVPHARRLIEQSACVEGPGARDHAAADASAEPDVGGGGGSHGHRGHHAHDAHGQARLLLPSDLVIGEQLAADAPHRVLDGVEVPDGWMGLDIGPGTVERYSREIAGAGTVFWNGPMGAFECEPFAGGTRAIAQAVAKAPGVTVVGGGDSAAALARFGLEDAVDHLSTGGGATLELIGSHPPATLPGVQALEGASVA
jgi:phosphoglycerate kinase